MAVLTGDKSLQNADVRTNASMDNFFPLSDNQQWLLATAKDSATINNIVMPLQINGKFDAALIAQAVSQLASRHEILRANLCAVDLDKLQFRKEIGKIFYQEDISPLNEEEQMRYVEQTIDGLNNQPIDLVNDPLFTVTMLIISDTNAVLFIFMHHIISDPESLRIILENLSQDVPAVPQQFSQYLMHEMETHSHIDFENKLLLAIRKLENTHRWVDYGKLETEERSAGFYQSEMPNALAKVVVDLARSENTTLFVVFLSVFSKTLSRIYAQSSFNIGVNISRRHLDFHSHMIGPLSEQAIINFNSYALMSYDNLKIHIKSHLHDIFSNQSLSLWQIYQRLKQTETDLSPDKLFNTLFDYEPLTPGITAKSLSILPLMVKPSHEMRRHLTLRISQTASGFAFQVRYRTALFVEANIINLVNDFVEELKQLSGLLVTS